MTMRSSVGLLLLGLLLFGALLLLESGTSRPDSGTSAAEEVPTDLRAPSGTSAPSKLEGWVQDRSGHAIEGAVVCAHEQREGPSHCVTTDESGAFALTLPDGRYELDASARGFLPTRHRGPVTPWIEITRASPPDRIAVTLDRGGVRFAGVIEDPLGRPVQSSVSIRSADGPIVPAASDGAGRFDAWVPGGSVEVVVDAPGYARAVEQLLAPDETVRIALDWECTLAGVVLDESGAPLARARIVAEGLDGRARMASTATDGSFRFAGIGEGRYRVRGAAGTRYVPALEVATTPGVPVDLVLRARSGGIVEIEVVGAREGRPRALEEVSLTAETLAAEGLRASSDGDGRAIFEGVAPGRYALRVHCGIGDWPSSAIEVAPAGTISKLVRCGGPHLLEGRIEDPSGAPVALAEIKLEQWTTRTGADGRFLIASVVRSPASGSVTPRGRPGRGDRP
jgi:protocatechuate 3,4-dioxygenase beta subunit